jgi:wyosine [tRNA(Phe)-imidazoG37] synthetase (radical SAM superfamily)
MTNKPQFIVSSVYGPLESWRLGKSLGIDLIMDPSTCSFNCTYCQLGFIQKITIERKIYVETKRVIEDFKASKWQEADVITFSGSGEPTLAINLGETIKEIKKITTKPVSILTNATMLNLDEVRKDVVEADIVSVKIDAPDDITLKSINRPADGITIKSILEGIKKLKLDIGSKGKTKIQVQMMFMPQNKNQIEKLAEILNEIKPDELALNTPTRPYPSGWDIITRGAHGEDAKKIIYETKPLKTLTKEEAKAIEEHLKELTGLKIISVFNPTM